MAYTAGPHMCGPYKPAQNEHWIGVGGGVLDAPRRGQDPSLRSSPYRLSHFSSISLAGSDTAMATAAL